MSRLRDKNKALPGGLRFTTPQNDWSIRPWSDWESAKMQIRDFRLGNPYLTQKHGWSTDLNVIDQELEAFQVAVCKSMGWTQFLTEGGPDPAPKAMSPWSSLSHGLGLAAAKAGNLLTGVATIADWEIASGRVVTQENANQRGKTCTNIDGKGTACPNNQSGDLLDWFTEQAAHVIRLQLETKNNMKLHTNYDPILGVCSACDCPLKLKLWAPIDVILSHIKPHQKEKLHPQCWILAEEKG